MGKDLRVKIERFENLFRLIFDGCGFFRVGCQVGATAKGAAVTIAALVTALALTGLPVMAFSAVIHPRMIVVVTGCDFRGRIIGLLGTAISGAGTDRPCPREEEGQTQKESATYLNHVSQNTPTRIRCQEENE